jgi:hypothetical protein
MKVQIKFLKQGTINVEIPDRDNIEDIKAISKSMIDCSSDNELINAMHDWVPNSVCPTVFDIDNFQVEAIEDEDNNLIYASDLWKEYTKESK